MADLITVVMKYDLGSDGPELIMREMPLPYVLARADSLLLIMEERFHLP